MVKQLSATGIFIACLFAFIGCGGDDGNNTAPVLTLAQSELTLDENTSVSLNYQVTDADGDEWILSVSEDPRIQVTHNANTLTINSAEVAADVSFALVVTASDGALSDSQTLTVNLKNILPDSSDHLVLKAQVQALVEQSLQELEGLDCTTEQATSPQCQKVSVSFSDGQYQPQKIAEDQTILFIDINAEFMANVTRRSRVRAMFHAPEGQLLPYDPEIELPQYQLTMVQRFDQLTEFVHAGWLELLADRMQSIGGGAHNAGHGIYPLAILSEHLPKASFVYLSTPKMLASRPDLLCALDFNALRDHSAQLAEQVKKDIIEPFGIDYISWSGGDSTSVMSILWSQKCPGQPQPNLAELQELENSLRPYYEVLFNTPGVLAVQSAGSNVSADTHVLDSDASFNNRIRVGYYQTLDSKLPIDGVIGAQQPPGLPDAMHNSREYVDVFINFGFTGEGRNTPYNASPTMQTDTLGLRYFPMSSSTTSWAAPFVLPWAIMIKNSVFPEQPMDNMVIEQIKARITPLGCDYHVEDDGYCKVQDPAWYKQHELARLKYLQ